MLCINNKNLILEIIFLGFKENLIEKVVKNVGFMFMGMEYI